MPSQALVEIAPSVEDDFWELVPGTASHAGAMPLGITYIFDESTHLTSRECQLASLGCQFRARQRL
mgnify:CR=1 FL=1